jgi:F1F0 ATPase subunit 2
MTVSVLSSLAWLALGALIGGVHFISLGWNVRLLASGRPLALGLAVQLLRFVLTGAALAMLAIEAGAVPLLLAGAGIVAARIVAVRQPRRA